MTSEGFFCDISLFACLLLHCGLIDFWLRGGVGIAVEGMEVCEDRTSSEESRKKCCIYLEEELYAQGEYISRFLSLNPSST